MSIPTTRLGRTGLEISRLALGTMTFGLQTEEPVAREIMSKAAAAGVNLFDVADVYPLGGGLATAGRTEEIVGRWLKGQRESFVLATKAVGKMGPNAWNQGASRKHLLEAIDASLRRLQTDYVDLYQLHSDDLSTPLDETLDALDALGRCELKGWARVVSLQPRYNLLFRQIERELLPLALEEGLGVIPYNPLAGGLLTGKYKPGSAPEAGTRFTLGTAASIYQDRYWNERDFSTVQKLQALAREAGTPLTTLAVAWTLANPAITAPLLGASRPNQLDDPLAAATYKLDPALKQRLDQLTAEYRQGDAPR
jgi:aryl-alcohol dehydrogenase-like predicted oxidoreductase